MFNWVKQTHVRTAPDVVGISEPIYGPTAIQSVAEQTKEQAFTELCRDDLPWEVYDSTCVETKTFYMMSDEGNMGLVQVIYSNVMGIQKTAQFSAKIMYKADSQRDHLWSSDNLSKFSFSDDKQNFRAEGCSMDLAADGKSYHIKSRTNPRSIVDLTFTQTAPGFMLGKDGTTRFGTDPEAPWGKLYHKFWPMCQVEGQILTQNGPVDFKGRGLFVHCLQGMKPHFAAAKWNFCNFQSPTYSAILMEFTTPPSYGSTSVAVGAIATRGQILFAGASPTTAPRHTAVHGDPDNDWPAPAAVEFTWAGRTADGTPASARLAGPLGPRIDRVDVMGELPKFVKQIVAGAAGTKPYIYQYAPRLTLLLDVGGKEVREEGQLMMEATFIS